MITRADPTVLDEIRHEGSHDRSLMWARNPDRWKNVDTHVYRARYGAHEADVQVNPDFTEPRARGLAERYARVVGQLPAVLREAVDEIEINPGDYSASGFHRGWACSIYVYVDMMEAEGNERFVEEIIAHEAAHCLESEHRDTSGWKDAQDADPEFISDHAEANPHQEDFAETFAAWMAVRYVVDRVDDSDRALIVGAIPNRLAYLDEAISERDMRPFERAPESRVYFVPFFMAADRAAPGFMRIVNRSEHAGTVEIIATDDRGDSYPPVTLGLDAREAKHFNANSTSTPTALQRPGPRERQSRQGAPGPRGRPRGPDPHDYPGNRPSRVPAQPRWHRHARAGAGRDWGKVAMEWFLILTVGVPFVLMVLAW